MDRKDLQELSKVRLKEATALLRLGLFAWCLLPGWLRSGVRAQGMHRKANLSALNSQTRRGWSPATPNKLGELIKVAGLDEARARTGRQGPGLPGDVGMWLSLGPSRADTPKK